MTIIKEEITRVTGGRLAATFIVGDSIHGQEKKNDGDWLIESRLSYQARAAVTALSPFREMSDEFFLFEGSPYHTGRTADTDETIGEQLDSTPDPWGRRVWMWMPAYEVDGFIFDIAHHQSVTIINRAMPLEREQRFAATIADLKEKPDVIIRAHAHSGTNLDQDGNISIGLMPLQLQTPYAKKSKWPNRWMTRWMGVTLIRTRPDLRDTLFVPLEIVPLRFKHPRLQTVHHSKNEGGDRWKTPERYKNLTLP